MKFKAVVIAMLAAFLIINAVGMMFLIKEEQKQTEIALAEYDVLSYTALAEFEQDIYTAGHDELTIDIFSKKIEQYIQKRIELGLDY